MKNLLQTLFNRSAARLDHDWDARRARAEYVDQWVVPTDLKSRDLESYRPTDLIGAADIELAAEVQLSLLARWKQSYAEVFGELRADPEINTWHLGKTYLHNGEYPTPDAEIYSAMILDYRPLHIIEVGAGFSTRIARKTIQKLGHPCRITVVDPEPRTDVSRAADRLILHRVEDALDDELEIDDKTLLFIDSSHIVRSRGDIPYLFNRIVPQAPAGVLVHVHDIFIPYDYPFRYQERLYTEQYVLHALLSHSKRYRVAFATHYMTRTHTAEMQDVFGPIVGSDDLYAGASFWFEITPD